VARIVRPALARGEWVLCDRFADSTLVYQSHVRGLDLAFVRSANAFATGGLVPDLTLLLDLDPELGLARVSSANRLDREPLEFHRAVRAGFLALAEAEPLRWRIIDAAASPTEVTDRIEHALPMR
jgi:dTMP kinase